MKTAEYQVPLLQVLILSGALWRCVSQKFAFSPVNEAGLARISANTAIGNSVQFYHDFEACHENPGGAQFFKL